MCGIIGYSGKFSQTVLSNLKNLMRESSIRGLHASGIAFWSKGKVHIYKFDESITDLAERFHRDFIAKENFQDTDDFHFIAHGRFSTSTIGWNQPIGDETMAIAHNGVITQTDPSEWEALFGYKCDGKNDSELLFRCLLDMEDPLTKFPNASISALVLTEAGVFHIANGKRPLWKVEQNRGTYWASTRDIFVRAGFPKEACVKLTTNDSQLMENML